MIFPPKNPHAFYYSKKHVRSRFVRSSLGIIGMAAIVFGLPALWWLDIIFGFIGTLFAIYFYQTWQQMRYAFVVGENGVAFGRKSLIWSDIKILKLRHFGGNGQSISLGKSFFELTLKGQNKRVSVDSDIDGFNDLLALVVGASQIHDMKIDESTAHNIAYLLKEE